MENISENYKLTIMKELSIEEKARRYDEAIEIAKDINNEQRAQPANVMTRVFPELKESEDERIRKEMIETLKNEAHEFPSSIIAEKSKSWIAWLEKQEKYFKEEPAEWSDEDERALNDAIVALSMYANGDIPPILPSILLEDVEKLKSLKDRYTWKPSKIQMSALKVASGLANTDMQAILYSLYNDLKKL